MTEEVLIRRVDCLGRILLPAKWRAKYLRKTRLVTIKIKEDKIVIEPVTVADLTEFLDSVEVDVESRAFEDYNKLKKSLLGK